MGLVFGCSTVVVVINAIALAFLILATITAPVVSMLSLAEADNVKYGVFGYCSSSGSNCSDATFPYKVTSLSPNTNDWKMDDSARDTLAKILIVTPIAAGLTLFSFIFNLFAHFKAFGSSLAFYLIGFFFTLLAFFGAAITCIVTFLLFFPHVTWCAWILIPAAILNLFAVPLMFFALRTTPSSFKDDDEEGEVEDKNLTDLSDGDNFKSNNEFKLDDFTGPNTTFTNSSIDKNIPLSTLKVITNDTSSMTDQRSGLEKATAHDYSTNKNPTKDFNYNGQIQTQHYGNNNLNNEGTPNLVSSQNYNRGGAVRSEAPSIKPQSAKPDYSTAGASLYPKSAYQSQNSAVPPSRSQQRSQYQAPQRPLNQFQSLQQPGSLPRNATSTSSSGLNTPGAQNTNAIPSNVSQSGVPSGVPTTSSSVYNNTESNYNSANGLGNSTHGSSASDDYDNELANDNDSDFTSVSQRAVNPRYYRGANAAPTLFPNQEQQQLVSPSQGPGSYFPSGQPQQQQYQQQPYPDYTSSHYSGSAVQPGPYSPQPQFQPGSAPLPSQHQQPPRKTASDVLLSTNPDFMVSGPAFQRQQFPRRANPQATGSYRPAYKRVQGGNSKITPASLGGDSPYNFK